MTESIYEEQRGTEARTEFTETDEYGHERNEVAKAEKEAASQETAGLLDQAQQ